jgi:hypothetical protein
MATLCISGGCKDTCDGGGGAAGGESLEWC